MRLLIFKVNQLGDNLVFLPAAQWLEKLLPGAEITIATSPLAAPLYHHCLPRAKVIEFPTAQFNAAWKRPWTLLSLSRQARRLKPDACLVANDQGNVAHLLARASGAGIRVGPRESQCRLRWLLSHQVPLDLAEPVALQNWRLARAMLDALDVDASAMPHDPPAPDVSALTASAPSEKDFVLVHPGASRAYHRWFIERYVELANKLARQIEVRFVLQGDPAESNLDARVQRVSPGSLKSFFELMSGARLFIGSNSGPMHVASVCGVPGVIFAGPSASNWNPMWHLDDFALLRDATLACQPCDQPSGPVHRCHNADEPMACMKRVSVDDAHQAARRKLGLP